MSISHTAQSDAASVTGSQAMQHTKTISSAIHEIKQACSIDVGQTAHRKKQNVPEPAKVFLYAARQSEHGSFTSTR